jgi:prepilin-type N-terminal cleavage/methylation domain-containing protein
MQSSISIPTRSRRGFTLVELLISLGLLLIALAGVLGLMGQNLRTYFYDSKRLAVNRDMRKFTQDLAKDVDGASYFMIFPDYSTRSSGSGSSAIDANVADGYSGDFLLLVSNAICVKDASNNLTVNGTIYTGLTPGKNYIYQMVGYYRDIPSGSAAGTTGPVRRVQYNFTTPVDPTAYAPTPIATLLGTAMPTANQATNPVVVQLAQGLAAGTLFYNFSQSAALVRAQIQENGNTRNAVNTYTFTVAPRG